jgi:hypothetical protein
MKKMEEFQNFLLQCQSHDKSSKVDFLQWICYLVSIKSFELLSEELKLVVNDELKLQVLKTITSESILSADPRSYAEPFSCLFENSGEITLVQNLERLDFHLKLFGGNSPNHDSSVRFATHELQMTMTPFTSPELVLFIIRNVLRLESCGQVFSALSFSDVCLSTIPENIFLGANLDDELEVDETKRPDLVDYLGLQELFIQLSAFCRLVSLSVVEPSLSFVDWVTFSITRKCQYHLSLAFDNFTKGKLTFENLSNLILNIFPEMFLSDLHLFSFLDRNEFVNILAKANYAVPDTSVEEKNSEVEAVDENNFEEFFLRVLLQFVESGEKQILEFFLRMVRDYFNSLPTLQEEGEIEENANSFFGISFHVNLFVSSSLTFDDCNEYLQQLYDILVGFLSMIQSNSLSSQHSLQESTLLALYEFESILETALILKEYIQVPPFSTLALPFCCSQSLLLNNGSKEALTGIRQLKMSFLKFQRTGAAKNSLAMNQIKSCDKLISLMKRQKDEHSPVWSIFNGDSEEDKTEPTENTLGTYHISQLLLNQLFEVFLLQWRKSSSLFHENQSPRANETRFTKLQEFLLTLKEFIEGYYERQLNMEWTSLFVSHVLHEVCTESQWKELLSLLLFEERETKSPETNELSQIVSILEELFPGEILKDKICIFVFTLVLERFSSSKINSFSQKESEEFVYYLQILKIAEISNELRTWVEKVISVVNFMGSSENSAVLHKSISPYLANLNLEEFLNAIVAWIERLNIKNKVDEKVLHSILVNTDSHYGYNKNSTVDFPGAVFVDQISDFLEVQRLFQHIFPEKHEQINGNTPKDATTTVEKLFEPFKIKFSVKLFRKSCEQGDFAVSKQFIIYFLFAMKEFYPPNPMKNYKNDDYQLLKDCLSTDFSKLSFTLKQVQEITAKITECGDESLVGCLFPSGFNSSRQQTTAPVSSSAPSSASSPVSRSPEQVKDFLRFELDSLILYSERYNVCKHSYAPLLIPEIVYSLKKFNHMEFLKSHLEDEIKSQTAELQKALEQSKSLTSQFELEDSINETFVNKLIKSGFSINGAKKAVFATKEQGTFEVALQYAILHSNDVDFDKPIVLSGAKQNLLHSEKESKVKHSLHIQQMRFRALEDIYRSLFPESNFLKEKEKHHHTRSVAEKDKEKETPLRKTKSSGAVKKPKEAKSKIVVTKLADKDSEEWTDLSKFEFANTTPPTEDKSKEAVEKISEHENFVPVAVSSPMPASTPATPIQSEVVQPEPPATVHNEVAESENTVNNNTNVPETTEFAEVEEENVEKEEQSTEVEKSVDLRPEETEEERNEEEGEVGEEEEDSWMENDQSEEELTPPSPSPSTKRPPLKVLLSPKLKEIHQVLALSIDLQNFLESVFLDDENVSDENLVSIIKKLTTTQQSGAFEYLINDFVPFLSTLNEYSLLEIVFQRLTALPELEFLIQSTFFSDSFVALMHTRNDSGNETSFLLGLVRFSSIMKHQSFHMTSSHLQKLLFSFPVIYLEVLRIFYQRVTSSKDDGKTLEVLKREAADLCDEILSLSSPEAVYLDLEKVFNAIYSEKEYSVTVELVGKWKKSLHEECQLLKRLEKYIELQEIDLKLFLRSGAFGNDHSSCNFFHSLFLFLL